MAPWLLVMAMVVIQTMEHHTVVIVAIVIVSRHTDFRTVVIIGTVAAGPKVDSIVRSSEVAAGLRLMMGSRSRSAGNSVDSDT